MSARASSATSVFAPLAVSMAYSAAVSRPRESMKYWVLPSTVKPPGAVVSESENGMSPTSFQPPLPSGSSRSLPPSARDLVAIRTLKSGSAM